MTLKTEKKEWVKPGLSTRPLVEETAGTKQAGTGEIDGGQDGDIFRRLSGTS